MSVKFYTQIKLLTATNTSGLLEFSITLYGVTWWQSYVCEENYRRGEDVIKSTFTSNYTQRTDMAWDKSGLGNFG